ncbi:ATP--cob(I)alamin adenosyltransferase [Fusibacter tunisiensis]|uniref:ATP:cob(I)alamin adenosyltransferase n=1 Tax=Fusibacter tunisiensis TaxID=1008308 RepID=A0ABS2MP57_9FIRM|nr:ATP--cob(I)alamin adenosyltransferase [Fusibacter tunisiensis]MBM7561186.1 ATP:cob(I)alamin adenosyltransferase [Fusibacter tunisiensis]
MQTIYRSKHEAYPFLSDPADDLRCDFEIMTDELASMIGLLRSTIKDEKIRKDLIVICELVYHLNPSLRTFVSVTDDEYLWLENLTETLQDEVKERFEKFVLTQGGHTACQAHVIRTKFKALVRLLYRHAFMGHDVPERLFDFSNLLSGYFFLLALKLNALDQIEEIEYISRNYK